MTSPFQIIMNTGILWGLLGGLTAVIAGLAFSFIFADPGLVLNESLTMSDSITAVKNGG